MSPACISFRTRFAPQLKHVHVFRNMQWHVRGKLPHTVLEQSGRQAQRQDIIPERCANRDGHNSKLKPSFGDVPTVHMQKNIFPHRVNKSCLHGAQIRMSILGLWWKKKVYHYEFGGQEEKAAALCTCEMGEKIEKMGIVIFYSHRFFLNGCM
jgi:hypothetical protein